MSTHGKVRVLPPDTPGLPEAIPFDPTYDKEAACFQMVWAKDHPVLLEFFGKLTEGAYCTRPKGHPESEIHTCRLRSEGTNELLAVIVWGGE